jgi:hypothetical protein
MNLWHMSSHQSYIKKAIDCLRAADMVHDSAERAALAKVPACATPYWRIMSAPAKTTLLLSWR